MSLNKVPNPLMQFVTAIKGRKIGHVPSKNNLRPALSMYSHLVYIFRSVKIIPDVGDLYRGRYMWRGLSKDWEKQGYYVSNMCNKN